VGEILVEIDRGVADAVAQIPRAVVPDMPDRIIAATAPNLGLPLVTADYKIQASSLQTIW
jgi:PIN domain nuclease of toxin-antitoxin system